MQTSRMGRSPYQGLVPYTERDARFFFGRDIDRQIIIANLYAARLTILYGASGVGKSSVLEAGVAYHLHRQPLQAVVVFKTWHADPVAGLKQAVARHSQILPRQALDLDDMPLDQFLWECGRGLRGPLMILLDQFEEYFLYHPLDDDPGSFAAQFARAVNEKDCPVSFLISLREDALAKLDRFERRIPNLFDNYLRLEHLDRDAARLAITRPLEVYNQVLPAERHIEVEDELVEEIIEQVKTGQVFIGQVAAPSIADQLDAGDAQVEAPYLQLVLRRLWDEEIRQNSRILRLSTLASLGGAQEIVRTHLDAAIAVLKPSEQDLSAHIFHYLVTPSGSKIAHTAADLASYAEVPAGRVQLVLNRLAEPDLRILRAVASGRDEKEQTRYEIFHDVLAPAVLDWRVRYLSRLSISRRLALTATIVVIAAIVLQFFSLPHSILALTRVIPLVMLSTVPLMQIYKWFSRHISLTTAAFSVDAFGGRNVPILLSILFTMLWYVSVEVPGKANRINFMGEISFSDYIIFQIYTLMLTLLFGFITFLAMRTVGQLTHRFFKNFDLGFYGVCFGIYILIAGLIIYTLLAHPHPLFTFG